MPWWSVLIDAPVQCLTRDSSTLSPDQRGMQLAGAHALSGVSMQVNLSLTSSVCVELDFATLPIMSTCVPLSFFCGAWSWQDQLTSSYLLTTVKSKACLHPLLLAQSKRDTNRQSRGDRPKWADIKIFVLSSWDALSIHSISIIFAAYVLILSFVQPDKLAMTN